MTKDSEEFSQFTDSVARREYTLPRDEDSEGTPKLGPYWKLQLVAHMEWKSELSL